MTVGIADCKPHSHSNKYCPVCQSSLKQFLYPLYGRYQRSQEEYHIILENHVIIISIDFPGIQFQFVERHVRYLLQCRQNRVTVSIKTRIGLLAG